MSNYLSFFPEVLFMLISYGIGAIPITYWVVKLLTGQDLTQVGTGNISVTAAFRYGGKISGIISVIGEVTKGMIPVYIAQIWFPATPAWQIVGLCFLVMGRYAIAKGGGVTNATWGVLLYSPVVALSSGIIGLLVLIVGRKFFPSQPHQVRLRSARWGCLSGPIWVLIWRQSVLEFLVAVGLALLLVSINIRQSDDFS